MGNERLGTVVLDAGPIIHLGKIDSLNLLSVFNKIVLPEAVYEEISVGSVPDELDEMEYELTGTKDEGDFDTLDRGESEALSTAQDLDEAVVFLTDDLDAREKAKELGIEVHGSVGVIVLGFRQGELDFDQASSRILALSEETDMFITEAVVSEGIRILRELKTD